MAHMIEPAKSGRASCRTCKGKIEKGALRFGEEVPNAFSDSGEMSYQWHHLECAAKKKPGPLKATLASYTGEIPNRADLEKSMDEAARTEKPSTFPYAERASTSRSSCQECEEKIEKGQLRVAIEREVETGTFMRKSAGYLHPACANAHTNDPQLLEKIKVNAPGLSAADLDELAKGIASGGAAEGGEDDEDE
jgi:hypothetical protein